MRPAALLAAVLSLLAVGLSALPAGAADPVELLPDLVADPVEQPTIQEYGSGASLRRLLRFDGFVHNAGPGAVAVRGSSRLSDVMGTREQLVDHRGGAPVAQAMPADASVRWEPEDGHDHWHLRAAARYSLWDASGAAQIGVAEKVGFCLMDSEPVAATWSSRRFASNCAQDAPAASQVTMGVAAGWRDVYDRSLAFQWVDISDVAPGRYLLRSEVDPDDVIEETPAGETNAPADVPVTIPGWVARPTAALAIDGGPVSVLPNADAVGVPRAGAEFRVEDLPAQGTVDRAPGEWSTAPIRYTPSPGWSGSDTFTVAAREAGTRFPRSPARATVTIGSGTGHRLTISGAPSTVRTGSVTRLSATIARGTDPADPGAVSWSADHGSITRDGVFTAPAQVPPGGTATVRAATPSGLRAETRMTVEPAPAVKPAPSPPRGTGVLRLSVRRAGGRIVVAVAPRRSGRLRLTVLTRGRKVSGCRLRVVARRSYACRLPAPRRGRPARIVASLRARNGRLLQQRLRVAARKAQAAGLRTRGA